MILLFCLKVCNLIVSSTFYKINTVFVEEFEISLYSYKTFEICYYSEA